MSDSLGNEDTRTEVVIIGAGPAGLAVGACLKRAAIPFVILERGKGVGASWRRHYERLRLHTDKARSGLPYLGFQGSIPKYPTRLQVIDYLERYARHFDLHPLFERAVVRARLENGAWHTQTSDARFVSDRLVVASGYNRVPHMPRWPGLEIFAGPVIHSSEYRSGEPYRGKRVLVVGFGNSGGEIALNLSEHGATPYLAVRSPVNIVPRELLGIPVLSIAIGLSWLPPRIADAVTKPIARLMFGDLSPYGLERSRLGPFSQILGRARIPLVDVGTVKLIKEGRIRVHPGVDRFTQDEVVFTDGERRTVDAVVLATGYHPAVDGFLESAEEALNDEGTPITSGHEAPIPGLYFCGFFVSPTGTLRDISIEARRIARDIARTRGG